MQSFVTIYETVAIISAHNMHSIGAEAVEQINQVITYIDEYDFKTTQIEQLPYKTACYFSRTNDKCLLHHTPTLSLNWLRGRPIVRGPPNKVRDRLDAEPQSQ